MRILLTGAAGFIGAAVARRLVQARYSVVGVDNLNDAYDVRLKRWRLAQLEKHKHFAFAHADIVDIQGLRSLWAREGPFGAVVCLAARAGVRESIVNPWEYMSANAIGTLNILELCRETDTRKVVLASSSSVYGANKALPYKEDAAVGTPLSPYAASKIAAEALAHSFHHLHGLDISVLRFFTVYGPAGRPDMSPFRVIRWILEGEAITIFGDGEQSRDYTYVEDVADGVVAALRPVGYEVFNLGSDRPMSLLSLIECVSSIARMPARWEHREALPVDVRATWADISKARKWLEWMPRTSIDEGLSRSVQWYRENREWAKGLAIR